MDLEVVGLIVAWIVYPISLSIIMYTIYKNHSNKRRYTVEKEQASKVKEENVHQKWLRIFTYSTMISITAQVTFYLTHKIPYICLATYILQTPFYTLSGVLITYYQIARLQYCFSVSQIHSKNYGISKGVFICLYVIGAILPISTLVLTYFGQSVVLAGYFGCHWVFLPVFNGIVVPIILLYYIFYDFLVLGIYIYKIYQIRKKGVSNTNKMDQDNIYLRINFILDKIKILTIIYEAKSIIAILLAMFIGFDLYLLTIVLPVVNCIDAIYSLITIYLMQEHNEHQYISLIRFVQGHKICCCYCCCKRVVDDTMRYKTNDAVKDESSQGRTNTTQESNNKETKTTEVEETKYETRNDPVEVDHERYVSEMTVDDNTATI